MDGLHIQMDDDWGYPYFRKPLVDQPLINLWKGLMTCEKSCSERTFSPHVFASSATRLSSLLAMNWLLLGSQRRNIWGWFKLQMSKETGGLWMISSNSQGPSKSFDRHQCCSIMLAYFKSWNPTWPSIELEVPNGKHWVYGHISTSTYKENHISNMQ